MGRASFLSFRGAVWKTSIKSHTSSESKLTPHVRRFTSIQSSVRSDATQSLSKWEHEKTFNYWEDVNNQKKFVNWAASQLHIKDMSDWYKITRKVRNSSS
jgi:hypothetical protein